MSILETIRPKRRSKPGSVPSLKIQRHVPLWLRALGWITLILFGAAAAIMIWQQTVGKGLAQRESLVKANEEFRVKIEALESKNKELQAQVDSADSKIQLERTTQQNLASQLRTLEAENGRMKADLAYMESLLPAGASASSLSIRRFVVEKDRVPNQWQIKGLIVQADKAEREFNGTMQVVISGLINGKAVTVTWPDANKDNQARAKLVFKRTQRIEETIVTPAEMTVKSLQLRVLEQGSVRAQQPFNL